jgi:WD40 repeat protein
MTQVTYALDGEAIVGYSKEDNLVQTLKTPKLPYCQHRPPHHMTGVTLLHFSLSGNLIASAGRDCIHVWKLSTCNRIQTLLTTDKDDRPFSGMGWATMVMEFSTQEQLLASGGKRGLLMVWNLNTLMEGILGRPLRYHYNRSFLTRR